MTNVAVVGGQWGDEGKGKIVDWLSSRSDIVVRFQGGHNAGHTLVVDGVTYKLSLLPSGVVRGGKISVIGNGVVIDPWALFAEIDAIAAQGIMITPDNLRIAENAVLILPIHGIVDRAREANNGTLTIGTTGRGIGPAYEDKIARRAIRACDLADPEEVAAKVEAMLHHHNALLRGLNQPEISAQEIVPRLLEIAPRLLPYLEPVWLRLNAAHQKGLRILFEGAQGAMLDVDHGTYPFVTSSNTGAGQAATGSGLGPGAVNYVLGIVKAYTTRVGMGPFPTELTDEVGERIGKIGHEFGTVTGRKRRCGWFDAVMVRQAVKTSGISGIALTKLDVLDGFSELKICTGYRIEGKTIDYLPARSKLQYSVEPVYETLPGWSDTTAGARSWSQLPAAAIKYVRRLEELIDCPVALLSTSPKREDVILVHDPFAP